MYRHHIESIEKLKEYYIGRDGVIAIILDGSIVRGQERMDSDIDAIVVLTEEEYEKKKRENSLAEIVKGYCTYEGGYFDVKYKTKRFLELAARYGSEPTRNSLIGARTIYTLDEEIPAIVERIGVFQQDERQKKLDVLYANLIYNQGYFMACLKEDDCYMKLHTASELIYSVYRMILEENGVLFPCNRRLEQAVLSCERKPEGIVELARQLETHICVETGNKFAEAFLQWTSYVPPADFKKVMTDYVRYYEEWWMEDKMPFVNEW